MRRSTQTMAQADPTRHSFAPRSGYVDHGASPAQVPRRDGVPAVRPRGIAQDGSQHRLMPAGGGDPLAFTWRGGAWHRAGGNRMAWTPEYLAAHGWRYVGPI